MSQNAKLLMVYNAEGGPINAVLHGIHKFVKPSTYPCSLCALTYGLVSMHRDWRVFLDALPLDVVIHHSGDFAAAYPNAQPDLPAILLQKEGGEPQVLVPAEQMDALQTLNALKMLVRERLTQELGSKILPA